MALNNADLETKESIHSVLGSFLLIDKTLLYVNKIVFCGYVVHDGRQTTASVCVLTFLVFTNVWPEAKRSAKVSICVNYLLIESGNIESFMLYSEYNR